MMKHLVILIDVLSRCITLSEAPCLARKCGTHRSEPAKPRLLYPLVWIPCYGIVFARVVKQSRLLSK
jgi:hypothetical protein